LPSSFFSASNVPSSTGPMATGSSRAFFSNHFVLGHWPMALIGPHRIKGLCQWHLWLVHRRNITCLLQANFVPEQQQAEGKIKRRVGFARREHPAGSRNGSKNNRTNFQQIYALHTTIFLQSTSPVLASLRRGWSKEGEQKGLADEPKGRAPFVWGPKTLR
jgi:hypothetical protein